MEMIIDCLVSPGRPMMGFIRYQHIKLIWFEVFQSSHQTLNAGNHNFLAIAGVLCHLKSDRAIIVFRWLINQLLPMGDNEYPTMPGDVSKRSCFANLTPWPFG